MGNSAYNSPVGNADTDVVMMISGVHNEDRFHYPGDNAQFIQRIKPEEWEHFKNELKVVIPRTAVLIIVKSRIPFVPFVPSVQLYVKNPSFFFTKRTVGLLLLWPLTVQ